MEKRSMEEEEELTEMFNKIIAATPRSQRKNQAPQLPLGVPNEVRKTWPLGDGRYDRNGKFTPTSEDLKALATKEAVEMAGGTEEVALAALDAVYNRKDIASAVLKKGGTQDQAQSAVNAARTS